VLLRDVSQLDSAGEQDRAIGLLHLHSKTYAGVRDALAAASSRIGTGTVIMLDGFLGSRDWRRQAAKAFTEVLTSVPLTVEYLGRADQAVAALVMSAGNGPGVGVRERATGIGVAFDRGLARTAVAKLRARLPIPRPTSGG
jgi:hypothetical protein